MDPTVESVTRLIESLAPPAHTSVPIRVPLALDECVWFQRAIERGIVRFRECPPECFRVRKWGARGPDHFDTPSGAPRHLFSKPVGDEAWLNREYVPHIAAFAYAIIAGGYDQAQCSFSRYRKFGQDLIMKRKGQGYETDGEFYDRDGRIHLQVEAKASTKQTTSLAAAIEQHGTLTNLPASAAKEIEYVLDLAPRYLWIVGPGSIAPARHVYAVAARGPLNAAFTTLPTLPEPPHTLS